MNRVVSYPFSVYRNSMGKSNMPRLLTYIVTYRCNARCVMCGSWEKPQVNELTADEIENIFLQFPKLDAVRLSGGEPFVRKDFDSIAHLAQRILKPFTLIISSNGFLTDRIISFCENRNKKIKLNIIISLDGFAEKHNSVRRSAGAWDNAVTTITELTKNRNKFNCNVMVNQTVIDEEGIEHYSLLRDFLIKYGIRHNVVIADEETGTYSSADDHVISSNDNGRHRIFGNLSEKKLTSFFAEVKKDLKNYPVAQRIAKGYYIEGIKNRILYKKRIPSPNCVALNSHIRLLPDGSVPVCQFNTSTIGNLRKESFASVWNGHLREKYLSWIRKCSGCWAECESLPNAIYSGGLIRFGLSSICKNMKSVRD